MFYMVFAATPAPRPHGPEWEAGGPTTCESSGSCCVHFWGFKFCYRHRFIKGPQEKKVDLRSRKVYQVTGVDLLHFRVSKGHLDTQDVVEGHLSGFVQRPGIGKV